MEIRHTIEILTKDIQDIEKLVGNLQNSQDGSAIELDLALSKMRNVYEILMMIKADRLHEMLSPEKVSEPVPVPVPQPQQAPQTIIQPQPQPEPQPEPQSASPIPQPAAEKETVPAEPEEKKDAEILGEKFSAESSINENMAGQRGTDMDTKLIGQPIDNISRNIGINDRFLIIRELFDGDADSFSNLVNNLEGSGNYQDAFGLLEKQFTSSMEHEGIEILSGLIKRRFIQD